MICQYCGSKQDKGTKCVKCGAPAPETSERTSGPFFYNGYAVYIIHEFCTDLIKCQFWLGMTLIETVQVPRDLLEELVHQGEDQMPVFWKLFEVAQGKEEVYRYQVINQEVPVMFEVRKIESPEHAARRQYIRELLDM